MSFPDHVAAVVSWLGERLPPEVRVVTTLPATEHMEAALPLVRVRRTPGGTESHSAGATILLEVESFAADEEVMWATAAACGDHLLALSGQFHAGVLFDKVTVQSGAGQATGQSVAMYDNPRVYRSFGIYRLISRS